jgi:hypothetical protein
MTPIAADNRGARCRPVAGREHLALNAISMIVALLPQKRTEKAAACVDSYYYRDTLGESVSETIALPRSDSRMTRNDQIERI